MSGVRDLLLVARREATERARSRAFLVSTAITLLLVIGMVAVSIAAAGGDEAYRIGITGEPSPEFDRTLGEAVAVRGASLETIPFASPQDARAAVAEGEIDGAVVGDEEVIVRRQGSSVAGILSEALTRARLIDRLDAAGLTEAILVEAASISVDATEPPADDEGSEMGFIAVVLLFAVITIYGQWVLLGVLEEKSNRIVELLLSATTVRSLLAGKILGIGVLGLAQMAVLVALGLAAAGYSDAVDLPDATYSTAIWSVVWFVLGYGFYAALFAAVGALISRTEDAQSASTPVIITLLIGYFVTLGVIVPNPDSTLSRVLSLLPPLAPVAFPGRLGHGVPLWESLAGVAITTIGIVLVIRLAARVYAGGLLISGGKVGLRQAWRAAGELAGR